MAAPIPWKKQSEIRFSESFSRISTAEADLVLARLKLMQSGPWSSLYGRVDMLRALVDSEIDA